PPMRAPAPRSYERLCSETRDQVGELVAAKALGRAAAVAGADRVDLFVLGLLLELLDRRLVVVRVGVEQLDRRVQSALLEHHRVAGEQDAVVEERVRAG